MPKLWDNIPKDLGRHEKYLSKYQDRPLATIAKRLIDECDNEIIVFRYGFTDGIRIEISRSKDNENKEDNAGGQR